MPAGLPIAATTPPLAVPSSLVRTSPVRPSAASNAATCASAFWPVLASSTSSVSCGAPSCALAITRRIFLSSSISCSCVGSRPAVSASTTSIAAGSRRRDGVEHHCGRIAAVLRDDLHVVARAPCLELLARGGAKGVARGEQHGKPLALQILCELADRRRLAGAVDAGQHDHERPLRADRQRPLERRKQLGERLLEQRAWIGSAAGALPASAQVFEQVLGRRDADVRADESRRSSSIDSSDSVLRPRMFASGRDEPLARQAQPGLETFAPWARLDPRLRLKRSNIVEARWTKAIILPSSPSDPGPLHVGEQIRIIGGRWRGRKLRFPGVRRAAPDARPRARNAVQLARPGSRRAAARWIRSRAAGRSRSKRSRAARRSRSRSIAGPSWCARWRDTASMLGASCPGNALRRCARVPRARGAGRSTSSFSIRRSTTRHGESCCPRRRRGSRPAAPSMSRQLFRVAAPPGLVICAPGQGRDRCIIICCATSAAPTESDAQGRLSRNLRSVHRGHEDLVRRAARLFDQVIVAIADSESKRPMFTTAERIAMAREVLSGVRQRRGRWASPRC